MKNLLLFTDGSVHPPTRIGYGAYLAVSERDFPIDPARAKVKVKRYEDTSSTKLEIQTLLWALNEVQSTDCKIVVHTDSQNIMSLLERREKLALNNYRSKQDKPIRLEKWYREFFTLIDQLDCRFVQVQGHQQSHLKNELARLFTRVDRAARNALRKSRNADF